VWFGLFEVGNDEKMHDSKLVSVMGGADEDEDERVEKMAIDREEGEEVEEGGVGEEEGDGKEDEIMSSLNDDGDIPKAISICSSVDGLNSNLLCVIFLFHHVQLSHCFFPLQKSTKRLIQDSA